MLSSTLNEQAFKHVYQNADITLIGDAAGLQNSVTAGSLYISAHTADPTNGDQTTSECDYGGYARVALSRDTTDWVWNAGGYGYNGVEITFPQAASGSNTVTHYGIGTASSGAGKLIEVRLANPALLISNPNILKLPVGTLRISSNNP